MEVGQFSPERGADVYDGWAEYWGEVAGERGRFLGEGDLLMPADEAAKSLARRRDEIVAAAEQIVKYNITGWGDVTIQHGPVVDFNAPYGRSGKYGFHYWFWGRALTRAFLLTRDEKYLAKFDALFNSWYEQRDKVVGEIEGLDPVYYELGLGVRNRVFFEYYCLPFERRSRQTHERMLKTLLGAARWLYQEEKRMYRGGNWQIMGSFGMVQIGLTIPEFTESGKWVELGVDRLEKHAENDFYEDGCHSERVPSSYSLVAYRDSRNLVHLLEASKEHSRLAEGTRARLKRMQDWFAAILPPDGYLPGINDGSRAKMPAGILEGPACTTSVHLPASGFTVFRGGEMYMLINHGPSGGGHSHADSLSFELHAYGRPLAIDSGIGLTYDDPKHVPWYTQSVAHNMLTVDGANIDRRQAEGRDVVFSSGKVLDYFAATHYGYAASKGVNHRRHFVFVRPGVFLIYDEVDGEEGGKLDWHVHLTKAAGKLVMIPSGEVAERRAKGVASVLGIEGYEGTHAEIDWVTYENCPRRFAVLMLAYERERPTVTLRTVSQDSRGSDFLIEYTHGDNDRVLIGRPGMTMESEGLKFSGACAVVRRRGDSNTTWAASHALTLVVDGRSAIESRLAVTKDGEIE